MAAFPTLATGAVAQYPLASTIQYATDVVEFIDGTEQRYRRFGSLLRRWIVQLDLLTEPELSAMAEFFRAQRGAAGTFSFTDPNAGTTYLNCRFASDSMQVELDAAGRGVTTLTIEQKRA